MWQARQHTLRQSVTVTGIGLHSGSPVSVELRPAPDGEGITLVRDDVAGAQPVRAHLDHALDGRYATSLGSVAGAWRVSTVEHLLATLMALGVDNVVIGVRGPEIPVLDGSAQDWVAAIELVGLVSQASLRRHLVIVRPIEFRLGHRVMRALPDSRFVVSALVRFPHPRIGEQGLTVQFDNGEFKDEIAWARTFGFLAEVEALRAAGLIRGGTLDNAVVYGPDGSIVNEGGLRSDDEAVRHKILDMLGDLALFGMPIVGRIEAELPGHEITHGLVREVLRQPDAWRIEGGGVAPQPAAWPLAVSR